MKPTEHKTFLPVLVVGADVRLLGWLTEVFGRGLKSVPTWMEAIAEAGTHGFAGPAVHWSADGEEEPDPDRYSETVFAYHAFMAQHGDICR